MGLFDSLKKKAKQFGLDEAVDALDAIDSVKKTLGDLKGDGLKKKARELGLSSEALEDLGLDDITSTVKSFFSKQTQSETEAEEHRESDEDVRRRFEQERLRHMSPEARRRYMQVRRSQAEEAEREEAEQARRAEEAEREEAGNERRRGLKQSFTYELSDSGTIRDLQEAFTEDYPYLRIGVYMVKTGQGADRDGGKISSIDSDTAFGDIRSFKGECEVEICGGDSPKDLEAHFRKVSGLVIKICYNDEDNHRYYISKDSDWYTEPIYDINCAFRDQGYEKADIS